ncbi:MAG: class II aldolase/adducin family protein [Alphaproteobacteria bacterium]|nr:class II aldolase/adducin family protein [Alphaproteobacteria bacterium]
MNSDLKELVFISALMGSNAAYAQGGGGNTSIKSGDRMWVKASGISLADVSASKGFVAVDHEKIRKGIDSAHNEADYSNLLQSSIIAPSSDRPSIETGFHALLGAAVLHSHSVWANLIACSSSGRDILKAAIPEALWIPYARPGLEIAKAISGTHANSAVIVLQNHGLIVSADSAKAAWKMHEDTNARIRSYLKIDDKYPIECDFKADADHLLFPDQAIYLSGKAQEQTHQAYNFIRFTLDQLGLSPNYLPPNEASALLNMESEKYRQKKL